MMAGTGVFFNNWCERVLVWLFIGILFVVPKVVYAENLPATTPPAHSTTPAVKKQVIPRPLAILPKVSAENRPLSEVYGKQESLVDWDDLVRIYIVFGILLLILLCVLWWLKKSGWAARLNQNVQLHSQPGIKPPLVLNAANYNDNSEGVMGSTLLSARFETEKLQYKPTIAYRESLGNGRELVTVFLAEKWYFLGVTGTQIQLIANLTEGQPQDVVHKETFENGSKTTRADALLFSEVYEKYIQSSPKQNGIEPNNTSLFEMGSYTIDDLEEFEIPDFEDVFEQA